MASLTGAAGAVLRAADPALKIALGKSAGQRWHSGELLEIGLEAPPDRPARPAAPQLLPPKDMPRRRGGSAQNRAALLHALAHIELNAIDLAWDIIARFSGQALPREFYDQWVVVALEETEHFGLLQDRLAALGHRYGDFPAHDGLWEAATDTSGDLLARLAIVPLVLEARGVDVTPDMIQRLERSADIESAAILRRIYADEIGHVAIGRYWFEWLCQRDGLAPVQTFHQMIHRYFRGSLKPPFNVEGRAAAGFSPEYYAPWNEGA